MDYSKLINRAFAIAWRYKILWIFGLFTGMGASNFDWLDSGGSHTWLNQFKWDFDRWGNGIDFDQDKLLPLLGGVALVIFTVWLVILIANRIATPALIDAVNNLERGGRFRFSDSFSRGIDLFWKFVGLLLVELFAWIASLVVVLPVCILLFITIIGIPIAIAVILFYIYFWFTYFALAERAVTVRGCSIGDGLSEAWLLIKLHFKATLMMGLITLGLSIAMGIAATIVLLIIGLPFGGLTWYATDAPIAGFLIGFLFTLPVALVIGGYTGTVVSSMYTMFYFGLVEPGGVGGSYTNATISPETPPNIPYDPIPPTSRLPENPPPGSFDNNPPPPPG